jgi:hypothetical protein
MRIHLVLQLVGARSIGNREWPHVYAKSRELWIAFEPGSVSFQPEARLKTQIASTGFSVDLDVPLNRGAITPPRYHILTPNARLQSRFKPGLVYRVVYERNGKSRDEIEA